MATTDTWKVHNLSLADANKHRYWALTCNKCRNLILARADHIRANEVKDCKHNTVKKIRLEGKNWKFAGR